MSSIVAAIIGGFSLGFGCVALWISIRLRRIRRHIRAGEELQRRWSVHIRGRSIWLDQRVARIRVMTPIEIIELRADVNEWLARGEEITMAMQAWEDQCRR